jgi:hypothetical protein
MHFTDSISHRRQVSKQRDFLSHFARSGNVLASAKLAGVSRQLVYYWRENSPTFAAQLSVAAGQAFNEIPADAQSEQKTARRSPGLKLERKTP